MFLACAAGFFAVASCDKISPESPVDADLQLPYPWVMTHQEDWFNGKKVKEYANGRGSTLEFKDGMMTFADTTMPYSLKGNILIWGDKEPHRYEYEIIGTSAGIALCTPKIYLDQKLEDKLSQHDKYEGKKIYRLDEKYETEDMYWGMGFVRWYKDGGRYRRCSDNSMMTCPLYYYDTNRMYFKR